MHQNSDFRYTLEKGCSDYLYKIYISAIIYHSLSYCAAKRHIEWREMPVYISVRVLEPWREVHEIFLHRNISFASGS